jgi:predicted component of type VI protein secretion system
MSAGDPESWARLRLAQGESTALTLELSSSLGTTTLTVGQSPGCDWIVREAGVAPVHFSLHWDGSVLRIADVYGAGGVRADGVLVGAQWRALTGRVRVDFGKAAIVVESAAQARASGPGNDPTPLPPMGSATPRGSVRPIAKATLLGVAPIDAATLPPHMRGVVAQDEAEAPPALRSHKPTLLGISDSLPPSSAGPSAPPSVRPRAEESGTQGKPPSGLSPGNATLMGVGLGPGLMGRRVGGGSLSDDDQRTIQGFPVGGHQPETRSEAPSASQPPGASEYRDVRERRSTQQGHPSDPAPPARAASLPPIANPSGTPSGSYRPAPPASASARPAPQGGWHETPRDHAPDAPPRSEGRNPVPQAVLVGDQAAAGGAAGRGRAERYSDAPTRMREPGTLDSKRPKRRFPWRYVGWVP